MMNRNKGFTLIELVMVIVILGILAAVAVPKYIDLKGDAAQAAVNGIAGELGAASAINYAAKTANGANGVAVGACSDAQNLLQSGLPAGYTVAAGTGTAAAGTVNCKITNTATTKEAAFVLLLI